MEKQGLCREKELSCPISIKQRRIISDKVVSTVWNQCWYLIEKDITLVGRENVLGA